MTVEAPIAFLPSLGFVTPKLFSKVLTNERLRIEISRIPGILGLEGYGIAAGCHADLVLLHARDAVEAIRLRAARLAVIRRGASSHALRRPRRRCSCPGGRPRWICACRDADPALRYRPAPYPSRGSAGARAGTERAGEKRGGDRHERNYPTSLLDHEHGGHCCQRGGRAPAIGAGAGRAAQVRAREGGYLARAALEALRAGR